MIKAKMKNGIDEVELPEPLLGGLLIEVIVESVEEYLTKISGVEQKAKGLAEKGFTVVAADVASSLGGYRMTVDHMAVPITKGRVIALASEAFGDSYKKDFRVPDGAYLPKVGDIVCFRPHHSYKVDYENKYHILSDEAVIGFYKRGEDNE